MLSPVTSQRKMVLVLDVRLENGVLKVSASEKDQGEEQTLRHYLDHEISETTIRQYTTELINCLNKANKRGRLTNESLNELKRYGQRLFDSLLPLTVKSLVSSSSAADLIVHMNDLLVDVPWELLFDGKDFLSLRFNMGRVVSTKQPVHAKTSRLPQGSLRMWVIADPKGDLEYAYQEGVELRNALDPYKSTIKIDLKTSSVDSEAFKLHLRDYDILHYAGHAYYDNTSPEKSGFLLEGSVFSARDALELVGERPLPALVFSNACQSGYSGPWHFERESLQKVYGMANAFLLAGARHFIGTLFRVGDEESKNFACYFYEQLLDGNSIGAALRQARLKMVKQYGYESLGWAGYICYGDPTYALLGSRNRAIAQESTQLTRKKRTSFRKLLLIWLALAGLGAFAIATFQPNSITTFLGYSSKKTKLSPETLDKLKIFLKATTPPINKTPLVSPLSDYFIVPVMAVYPFSSDSGDINGKYSQGIQKVIIGRLSELKHGILVDLELWLRNMKREITSENLAGSSLVNNCNLIISGNYSMDRGQIRYMANILVPPGNLVEESFAEKGPISKSMEIQERLAGRIKDYLSNAFLRLEMVEMQKKKSLQLNVDLEAYKFLRQGAEALSSKNPEAAITALSKAIEIDSNFIEAYIQLGEAQHLVGNDKAAKESFLKARELSWKANDKLGLFDSLIKLSSLNRTQIRQNMLKIPEVDEAIFYNQEALRVAGEVNRPDLKSMILGNLSILSRKKEEFLKALDYGNEALSLAKQYGLPKDEAQALSALGDVYEAMGNRQKAYDMYYQITEMGDKVDNNLIALAYSGLATASRDLGLWDKAIVFSKFALEKFESLGDEEYINSEKINLAISNSELKKYSDVVALLETVIRSAHFRTNKAKPIYQLIWRLLIPSYISLSQFEKASQLADDFINLYQAEGNYIGLANVKYAEGFGLMRAAYENKSIELFDRAEHLLSDALDLAVKHGLSRTDVDKIQKALETARKLANSIETRK